jgi:hypothetical protein
MTPLEFITRAGEDYNQPVGEVMEALSEEILILSANKRWVVLSYYHDEDRKRMVLDIEERP